MLGSSRLALGAAVRKVPAFFTAPGEGEGRRMGGGGNVRGLGPLGISKRTLQILIPGT